jgi:hypothetical protein
MADLAQTARSYARALRQELDSNPDSAQVSPAALARLRTLIEAHYIVAGRPGGAGTWLGIDMAGLTRRAPRYTRH